MFLVLINFHISVWIEFYVNKLAKVTELLTLF